MAMKKIIFIIFLFVFPTYFVLSYLGVTRVSINDENTELNGDSENINPVARKMSDDGRYVVFSSLADNLVLNDTNGVSDIFVYDRQTGTTERVSVDSLGNEGDEYSIIPTISTDGRFVAFLSSATNLVENDLNFTTDVFVHDRQTGTTERVSVDSLGNEGDGDSVYLSISADGRFVAFGSNSTNLVANDTNFTGDIFVHDRQTGTTERVSVDSLGNEGDGDSNNFPFISDDGRYVVFSSAATNFVLDDLNNKTDIFVHDRQTGTTERVSVDSLGNEGDGDSFIGTITSDGKKVFFESWSSNFVSGDTNNKVDLFVRDLENSTTERVSLSYDGNELNDSSFYVSVSGDGEKIVFQSLATNVVESDSNGYSDIFIRDLSESINTIISINKDSVLGNGESSGPYITPDGSHASFYSSADNLVDGDNNNRKDVFVYSFMEDDIEIVTSSAPSDRRSSGSLLPNARLKDYSKKTNSRFVEIEVVTPSTISYFEVSNTPDFKIKEVYPREFLFKYLNWDLCKGENACYFGDKNIYFRFYSDFLVPKDHILTIEYLNNECPYFKDYLKIGWQNSPDEVRKVQEFLNQELGLSLKINGVFDRDTHNAVKKFQSKYKNQIINPWPNLKDSTGFWYITTSGFANILLGC